MAQISYNYTPARALPGNAVDTSPHSIVARSNEETIKGVIKFGMGVVQGSNPGATALLPVAASTAAKFEGIVCAGVIEINHENRTEIGAGETLGILLWGKRWVRVPDGLTVAYGDKLYLINDGADAGKFRNDATDAFAVSGRFIGTADGDGIAPAELFNAPNA